MKFLCVSYQSKIMTGAVVIIVAVWEHMHICILPSLPFFFQFNFQCFICFHEISLIFCDLYILKGKNKSISIFLS